MRKLRLDQLGRVSVDEFEHLKKIPVTVVLDNIRSAMNVGSVFRTSDAFLIEEIVLTGISACPPHKEINKTAIGAQSTVNWTYQKNVDEAVIALKKRGYQIVGIEQTDESISLENYIVSKEVKYALVFGNEVEGINSDVLNYLDACIEIPQYGTKHSLNISVCAGIILWHFRMAL